MATASVSQVLEDAMHHDPLRGKYRSLKTLGSGDTLAISAAKNRAVEIGVAKLL